MAARPSRQPVAVTADREQPRPPYYVAVEPLFIGGQFGRAFNVGDLVPADHVDTYGWADKVRLPEGVETPDQSNDEPDTADSGQATSKEGEA
ncbi:hypothetical protein ACIBQ1_09895 [Nonomuraea sp. NPDC050153]|uniref:hypothetical protein n=1 Tax=Nonomuraea sp. NPDC050153 TaxID=3364359 RepID=UPI0037904605